MLGFLESAWPLVKLKTTSKILGWDVESGDGGVVSSLWSLGLASDRPADAVSSSMESMVVSALRVYFCLYSDNSYHIKTYMLIIYKDTIWKKG